MEAGRCTLSWAGTGGLFEGLFKKLSRNQPRTRRQGARGHGS